MEGLRLIIELYTLVVFLTHYTRAGCYNRDEKDFLSGISFIVSKISKLHPTAEGIAEVVKILKI